MQARSLTPRLLQFGIGLLVDPVEQPVIEQAAARALFLAPLGGLGCGRRCRSARRADDGDARRDRERLGRLDRVGSEFGRLDRLRGGPARLWAPAAPAP